MNFGYAQTVPATSSFETPCSRDELEHVRAHDEVREPVAAGVRPVRADPADLGREVEDDLRLAPSRRAARVVPAGQVVLGPARNDDLVAALPQPLDEERAEEPGAARDESLHYAAALVPCIQSTRPTQLSRFAAYQAIVRRTPSSQETFGFQPVSAFSLS